MYRSILSFILASAIIAGGLPVSVFEDADRDLDVDLRDAVQWASQIAETADDSHNFKETFQRAVSALHVAAGLKTVIRSADDEASDPGNASSSGLYLISSNASTFPAGSYSMTIQDSAGCPSRFIAPPSPPPEIC
jgi:hypothetical protein